MPNMQFSGKLTQADLNDVGKMTRSRAYWLKLLLANWYGIGLIIAISWAMIAGLMGQTKPNRGGMAIIWVVTIGIGP
jgi:hypothetical protein